jgi:hypothetical protein
MKENLKTILEVLTLVTALLTSVTKIIEKWEEFKKESK